MTAVETEVTAAGDEIKPTCSWKIAAAQTRGLSHQELDLPCQDAMSIAMPFPGTLIIAVADGAGSAKESLTGATLAVRTSVESLCRQLIEVRDFGLADFHWETILGKSFVEARSAIEENVVAGETVLDDFATTLIVVVVRDDLIAAAQVGDGATIIEDESGTLQGLTVPVPGEYVNETIFLTSKDSLLTLQRRVLRKQTKAVATFTDGLQLLCLSWPDCSPSQQFFAPLFRFIVDSTDEIETERQMSNFLGSKRIQELTEDDLTLVLAARADDDES